MAARTNRRRCLSQSSWGSNPRLQLRSGAKPPPGAIDRLPPGPIDCPPPGPIESPLPGPIEKLPPGPIDCPSPSLSSRSSGTDRALNTVSPSLCVCRRCVQATVPTDGTALRMIRNPILKDRSQPRTCGRANKPANLRFAACQHRGDRAADRHRSDSRCSQLRCRHSSERGPRGSAASRSSGARPNQDWR